MINQLSDINSTTEEGKLLSIAISVLLQSKMIKVAKGLKVDGRNLSASEIIALLNNIKEQIAESQKNAGVEESEDQNHEALFAEANPEAKVVNIAMPKEFDEGDSGDEQPDVAQLRMNEQNDLPLLP